MAKLVLLLVFLTSATVATFAIAGQLDGLYESEETVPRQPKKLTHLRFYWHDITSGSNPTSVTSNASSTFFGMVNVIDDPFTAGPESSSLPVGRAQGLYAMASQQELGLIMAMNFAFVEGKYNGSTVTVLGRNAVLTGVREMPVVGGSGLFRFARGYVEARTYSFDTKSGDATVEYNVFVTHY